VREIDAHTESFSSAELVIESQRIEVWQLLCHPSVNVRCQLLPAFFRQPAKCSPDDEIVLDIERFSSCQFKSAAAASVAARQKKLYFKKK